jgi:HEPN domain-containing protein
MKNIIKDWFDAAYDDIWTIKELLDSEYIPIGTVTFHCQQAIEKYFKAFLIENGWELQKTHNLVFLYKEIKKIKDLNLDENKIKEISDDYAINSRYPATTEYPCEQNVREYYKFALEVKSKIEQELQ